jgi:SAM-dependent methyltransferase
MLLSEAEQTHPAAFRSLEPGAGADCTARESDESRAGIVDHFVQAEIVGTNGLMFRSLRGRLRDYPIPTLRLPPPQLGATRFLDLGCGWGRWCIAARRLGYSPVGIDVSLDAIHAAYRVSRQLGVDALFVAGDVRFLPFRDGLFDVAFSYSVLQHFSKADAVSAVAEAGRALKPGGLAVVQMANVLGLRSIYHQLRRSFRPARAFEVRYWWPGELRATLARLIGPTDVKADGYFSLNPQASEAHMLPWAFRAVIAASEMLRTLSTRGVPVTWIADSLYVTASKPPDNQGLQ